MGRHGAPELDSPTVAFARYAPPATWLDEFDREATSTSRPRWGVAAAMGAALLGFAGVAAIASTSSSAHTDPAAVAREQGRSYGEQLRDAGNNGMSIAANCTLHTHGYSGDLYDDYEAGCASVWRDVL